MDGQVLSIGFVDPEAVPRYLACLDVYVCPSMRETYGISVVQAMAMGLPVVHHGVDGIQVGFSPVIDPAEIMTPVRHSKSNLNVL